MIRKSLLAAVTAVMATAAVLPAAAGAAPKSSAQVLGTVVSSDGGKVAQVKARYTCTGDAHLWVSAKQTADGSRDSILTQEGSSQHAASYLQQHPQTLVCDGRNHVQTFTIDQTEVTPWSGGPVGKGALVKGQAWVQFCLYDDNAAVTDNRWTVVR